MIRTKKYVLIAVMLLSSALAYAASRTASVTVTVTGGGGGVACDAGPNYTGSIPAAAQAAGYTRCLANYDFTSAFFANPATWLDCKGAGSPVLTLYGPSCNDVFMTADPNTGDPQVLALRWEPGFFGGAFGTTTVQSSGANNNSNISQALLTMPTGKYVEVVTRTPAAEQTRCTNCPFVDLWSYGGNGNPNFIEWDFIEMYNPPNGNGGVWHPFNGAHTSISAMREPGMQGGYDPSLYHTYAMRTASDTSGNIAVCNYLDGVMLDSTLQGSAHQCATGTYGPVPVGRNFVVMSNGPQGGNNYSATSDIFIKSFRIWVCPGGNVGECTNSTASVTGSGALTGPP